MDCPCCDGLGMIGDPMRAGFVKKCPECDTPPAFYFLPLATIVGPPEEGEREWYTALEARRLAAQKEEDDRVAVHAMLAGPNCRCKWCVVQEH